MGILEKAIFLAAERHAGMVRKGTNIPYIVHPMEAVAIAAGITSDPEILAAAVLHDVVEDASATIDEIEAIFGKRIATMVAAESEDKMPGIPPSESWESRKMATIETLRSASYDEKIIVLADKLSNIRAINRDFASISDDVWERFNQKDKDKHEWYYREIAGAISELSGHIAYQEFCRLIDTVFKSKSKKNKERVSISKYLSLILRHRPEKIGIKLDENGWADVAALMEGANKAGRITFTLEELKDVVQTNDKQRFTFNDDFTKIRANQGHSVKVDVELEEAQPPTVLFHGTGSDSLQGIMTNGILSKKRLYVHLSSDVETATKVGKRHKGETVILEIDAAKMHKDGIKFYLSVNGVWLTDSVPVEYIRQMNSLEN